MGNNEKKVVSLKLQVSMDLQMLLQLLLYKCLVKSVGSKNHFNFSSCCYEEYLVLQSTVFKTEAKNQKQQLNILGIAL